ncbi:MAG: hypothetical protein P9X24_04805 [Candidatus Hatepunaea meridiana]|nr:hypothetical protein [Candidatus Hatepunaea meridiana]
MVQSDFWNKLKKRLRDVSTAAADFTEEQALIGKLKFDILNIKRKIDRKQREIGVRICELAKEESKPKAFEDGEIIGLITEIVNLEEQVDEKRDTISTVADQVRSKREEKPEDDIDIPATDDIPEEPEPTPEPAPTPEPVKKAKASKPKPKKTTKKSSGTQKTTVASKSKAKPKSEKKEAKSD